MVCWLARRSSLEDSSLLEGFTRRRRQSPFDFLAQIHGVGKKLCCLVVVDAMLLQKGDRLSHMVEGLGRFVALESRPSTGKLLRRLLDRFAIREPGRWSARKRRTRPGR